MSITSNAVFLQTTPLMSFHGPMRHWENPSRAETVAHSLLHFQSLNPLPPHIPYQGLVNYGSSSPVWQSSGTPFRKYTSRFASCHWCGKAHSKFLPYTLSQFTRCRHLVKPFDPHNPSHRGSWMLPLHCAWCPSQHCLCAWKQLLTSYSLQGCRLTGPRLCPNSLQNS